MIAALEKVVFSHLKKRSKMMSYTTRKTSKLNSNVASVSLKAQKNNCTIVKTAKSKGRENYSREIIVTPSNISTFVVPDVGRSTETGRYCDIWITVTNTNTVLLRVFKSARAHLSFHITNLLSRNAYTICAPGTSRLALLSRALTLLNK